MRRTRSVCCVWAESGQTTAAPPRIVMNSRRRIASPEAKDKASYRLRLAHADRCPLWVISGHVQHKTPCPLYPEQRPRKRTPANGHVRFTPKSGHVQCSSSCLLWAKSGHLRLAETERPPRGGLSENSQVL